MEATSREPQLVQTGDSSVKTKVTSVRSYRRTLSVMVYVVSAQLARMVASSKRAGRDGFALSELAQKTQAERDARRALHAAGVAKKLEIIRESVGVKADRQVR